MLARVVAAAGRRPRRTLAVAVLVVLVFGALATQVRPTTDTDTFVGAGTGAAQATKALHADFGDDAVVVLVRGQLTRLVLTEDLQKLIGLEGCIAGNVPQGVPVPGGTRGPCGWFARNKPVRVVYGPGTFINSAVNEIQAQLAGQVESAQRQAQEAAAAARELAKRRGRSAAEQRRAGEQAAELAQARFTRDLLQLAVRYGLTTSAANPTINNPDFIYQLVFDPERGAETPKARFSALFPSARSAAIQVRLKPGLDDEERAEVIRQVRAATAMSQWRLTNGGSYLTTGAPVLLSDVAADLTRSLVGLLIGGLLLMAVVLALVFRRRARMLPLGVAAGSAALVFGGLALLDVPVTLASIAVLPVLLGLGVDYAIQYHARALEHGIEPAAQRALPTIATAMLATVVGFVVLLTSPVPMVRGFGLLLMLGVVLAFALAITAGTAALTLVLRRDAGRADRRREAPGGRAPAGGRGRRGAARAGATAGRALTGAGGALTSAGRGAGELLAPLGRLLLVPLRPLGRGLRAIGRGGLGLALRRPVLVLAAGVALALGGWALDGDTEVVSDVRELVPADTPALRDLQTLQEDTGVAGEIDVLVRGDDLARPEVIEWMTDYRTRIAERFAFSADNGCGQAEVCPALSLTDLFRSEASRSTPERIRALLEAVPDYFRQAVITDDRDAAVMAFGIKLMPLEQQEQVLDQMRDQLDPPRGVRAELAGLPVLVSQANADLSSTVRRLVTLAAGLLLVGLALLLVYRRAARAWVPIVPIALATGWSALVLWLTGIPLNPMSATLGALVIAISTEFAVLLVARYHEERERGGGVQEALRRTYASTGAAVLASGVTAIAGFAVLAFSDVRMLSDFGRVTVIDLTVSLLGVLVVLPAVIVLRERRLARRTPQAAARAPEAALVP